MTWASPNLVIGGVTLAVPKALSLTQSYEDLGGVKRSRLATGNLISQAYWTRLRVNISGEGQIPPGIAHLDWTSPQVVACTQPRTVDTVNNYVTLPTACRSDVPIQAVGWVNGYPVTATVTVNGQTATASGVTGADYYTFYYYPQITAYLTKSESSDRVNGGSTWNIVAEEI